MADSNEPCDRTQKVVDSDEELENLRQAALRTLKSSKMIQPPPVTSRYQPYYNKNFFKRRNGTVQGKRSNLIVINPIRMENEETTYSVPLPQNRYSNSKTSPTRPARRNGPSRFRYEMSSGSSTSEESDYDEKEQTPSESSPATEASSDSRLSSQPSPSSSQSPGIRSVIVCPESSNPSHSTRIPVHLRLGSPPQSEPFTSSSQDSSSDETSFTRIESVIKPAHGDLPECNYSPRKRFKLQESASKHCKEKH